jgi:CO/xanthine dehydrogenase FAD-binding subunit
MKPAPFIYHDPSTLEEALELLATHGEDAKVLAGGQSLIPLMNLRLARPKVIVDINRIAGLDRIERMNRGVRVGALARQSALESSPEIAREFPLLHEAVRHVAHPQIRNRGTLGGSAAHADPAAELPVALMAHEAIFHARSRRAQRSIPAADFFVSHLTTVLADDEVLVETEIPRAPSMTGAAFEEFARRHGDYALGGAAVLVTVDEDGTCMRARIVLLGAAGVPFRAAAAENLIVGQPIEEASAREAAALATDSIRPATDMHGDGAYRRDLIAALCARAISRAAASAARTVR